MKTQGHFIDSLSLEFERLSAQIDRLAAKAELATANMKVKYAEELEALHVQKNAVAEQIKELQEDTGDAWETVKETTDKLWKDLKSGVNSAIAKFR